MHEDLAYYDHGSVDGELMILLRTAMTQLWVPSSLVAVHDRSEMTTSQQTGGTQRYQHACEIGIECFTSRGFLRTASSHIRLAHVQLQHYYAHPSKTPQAFLGMHVKVECGSSPRLVQQASTYTQPVERELMSIPLASGPASSVLKLSKCASAVSHPAATRYGA
jgi:hypothetical protein